ncbi:uncharacterized protein LOC116396404 [Anarrhichthys ocellatus]|uniref:uncharacterized protein LOC116396404 n=1 Tax=Anarrhichthys ocellatus TaxID=433405 RepID=UPI0012EE3BBC|nr:uncharacterized protein LOC116396404 [Anarrhichthys ocellatus]
MTSWTYMTHIFVLVFLNAIGLSKEACDDHLDMEFWANEKNGTNLNDTFSLVTTKDPKDTVNCSLEVECLEKGDGIGCYLLKLCLFKLHPNKRRPECEGKSTKVHIYHFMCFMAKAFDHPLEGCEYNTVCKIFAETASTQSETLRLRKNLKETQKETDKLKMLLGLSLVLHVIVPLAGYLYMRHQWMRDRMRDRMHSSLIHMCNGNLTADPPKKEPDAPPASLDKDAENTHLIKMDKHSDDAILNCDSGEDHTQL